MTRPKLKIVHDDPPGPSRSFISLTRNPDLALRPPKRFEPTLKAEGDVVL